MWAVSDMEPVAAMESRLRRPANSDTNAFIMNERIHHNPLRYYPSPP